MLEIKRRHQCYRVIQLHFSHSIPNQNRFKRKIDNILYKMHKIRYQIVLTLRKIMIQLITWHYNAVHSLSNDALKRNVRELQWPCGNGNISSFHDKTPFETNCCFNLILRWERVCHLVPSQLRYVQLHDRHKRIYIVIFSSIVVSITSSL